MEIKNLPAIGIKPLMSLLRHYRIAAAVWLLVFLIGTPIAWEKGQPHYLSESVFQVSPTYMKNIDADSEIQLGSNSQYREYVSHLSRSVTRYDIIERALQNLSQQGVELKPPELTERKFIEKLQQTVFVVAIPNTYMVRIGIESNHKQDLDTLINAITQSFLETTKKEQIYGSEERLQFVEDIHTKLRTEIAASLAQRVILAEKLGVTTFSENTQNPYDAVLTQARDRLTRAAIELTEAQVAFETFNKQKELPADSRLSLRDVRQLDLGMQTMRNEVFRRAEQITQALSGLTKNHPLYDELSTELAQITSALKAKEDEYDLKSIQTYQTRLTSTLDQKIKVEQEIRKTLVSIEAQAAEYARLFQQAMQLTNEIKNRETELTTVRNRENFLDTERNALGFVRLVTPALSAETPTGFGKKWSFGILCVLAFALALSAAIALDMTDRRIRSVNEAEQLMGIASAGWQIQIKDLPTKLFGTEQSRRFASTLIRNQSPEERQAFSFSSVKASEGVLKIILDTAHSLRQLGQTVLVIDANITQPSFTGHDKRPGLTDYLAGSATATEVIHSLASHENTIDMIEIGNQSAEGLKHMGVLSSGINQWKTEYDFVLIALPPMLLSADAELLIETLGQVFLVIEAESVLRGEVSRAKRLLQKIDPKGVGLFVNNVPVLLGGGYIEQLVAETITQRNYRQFMTVPHWALQMQILWTKFYVRQYKRL